MSKQWDRLPDICFISHDYDHCASVKRLKCLLPPHVTPIVFPEIRTTPDQRVSDDIVKTLVDCTGLIYLTDSLSTSVWVEFERDFALRNEKAVFSFDPEFEALEICDAPPVALNMRAVYAPADETFVSKIATWMKAERHFGIDLAGGDDITEGDLLVPDSAFSNESVKNAFLVFVSRKALNDRATMRRLLTLLGAPWQVLLVRLDDMDVPRELLRAVAALYPDNVDAYEATRTVLERSQITPRFDHLRPDGFINWNLIDDLVVRLYYLMNHSRLVTQRRMMWDEALCLREFAGRIRSEL